MGDPPAEDAASNQQRLTGGSQRIDISEFHRHPAQVVRLVEAGAVIQLTRGGLPVLRIVPEPAARPADLTA